MHNAMTNQANKQPGVLRRLGTTGALIVAACLVAGATFIGYGVDANLPWPVTANTTIAAKYCQGTVLAGTGSTGQFTLTLPAVTGFPTNCSVLIKNGDSTNGKILSGFPSDLYPMLWPKQSVGVKIVNGAWQTFYNPGPWVVPVGGATLYASPTGVDTNDGLTSTTPRTFAGACSARSQFATFLGAILIQLADGTYSTAVGGALCTIQGDSGGSSSQLTSIQGDSVTPTNVVLAVPNGDIGILIQDGGEAGVNNLEFTLGTASVGMQVRQLAIGDYNNIYWGLSGSNSVHFEVTDLASGNPGNETILANFYEHWEADSGSYLTSSANTAIPSAVTWSQFMAATSANVNLNAWTYSGSGAAGSTGATFIGTGNGRFVTPNNLACSGAGAFPGNGNCQFYNGYQDNAGDPQSTPWSVPNGGTGNATATAHSIPVSEGTAAQNRIGPCTTNQVIVGQGSSADPACGGVPAAALPNPSASTLGGIESIAALAHNWIASIDTSGVPHQSQPATTDLSDVIAPTSWTATDASGASLSFSTSDTLYTKIGKACTVSFAITYPTTVNSSNAQIGGIPAACAARNGTLNYVASGAIFGYSTAANAALQTNGQSLFILSQGGGILTNANLSGLTIRGTITYITN